MLTQIQCTPTPAIYKSSAAFTPPDGPQTILTDESGTIITDEIGIQIEVE